MLEFTGYIALELQSEQAERAFMTPIFMSVKKINFQLA